MVAVWLLRRRGCGHHDGVMQVAVKPATGRRPMMLRHATRGLIMAQNVVDAFDAKLLTDLVDKHRRRAQRDLDKLQEAELAAFGDGSKKDQLRAKQKAQKLQMMQALDEMDSSLATLLDSDVDPDEDPELGPAGCGSGCEPADVPTGTDLFHRLTIAVVRCLEGMGSSRQSSSLTTTLVSCFALSYCVILSHRLFCLAQRNRFIPGGGVLTPNPGDGTLSLTEESACRIPGIGCCRSLHLVNCYSYCSLGFGVSLS
jgi:hypothetical protein